MEPIIIDQRTDVSDAGYAARRLWQVLYKLTNAHAWRSLDNFLVDLKVFEEYVDKVYSTDGFKLSFYWQWHESGSTWVFNDCILLPNDDNILKITIDRSIPVGHKIIIEGV